MVDGRGVVRRGHCQAERCPDVDRHIDDRVYRSRANVFEIIHGTVFAKPFSRLSLCLRAAQMTRSVILQTFVKRAAVRLRHGNHVMPREQVYNGARGYMLGRVPSGMRL